MSATERLYIRWPPEDASEPTSTLVLTTPKKHFVDLRFLIPPKTNSGPLTITTADPPSTDTPSTNAITGNTNTITNTSTSTVTITTTETNTNSTTETTTTSNATTNSICNTNTISNDPKYNAAPPSTADSPPGVLYTALEWGIAGRSVGTPTHGKWLHDISSRTAHPSDETDEGDLSPHPTLPGVELERGQMRHPVSGAVRAYEEAWKPLPVLPVPGETHRVAVRLEMRPSGDGENGRRGAIVRVGRFCQGIVRVGPDVSAQRWQWANGAWTKTGQVGAFDIPCAAAWAGLDEGDMVVRGGETWDVVEKSLF